MKLGRVSFVAGTWLAALAAVSWASQRPSTLLDADDLAYLGKAPAGERILYGPDPLQFGELYVPAGEGPFPVVVYFHGGCWLAEYGDLTNSRALANAIAGLGAVVWNVEYRLSIAGVSDPSIAGL